MKADKTPFGRSPWTGKPYTKRMTTEDYLAESKAVLERHPTISKAILR